MDGEILGSLVPTLDSERTRPTIEPSRAVLILTAVVRSFGVLGMSAGAGSNERRCGGASHWHVEVCADRWSYAFEGYRVGGH